MRRASGGPPVTEGVPVVGVHAGLSVLTTRIATLSEAVPATVRSSDPTIAPFDGERIVTCGAILSGLRTVTERPVVSASPCESRISNVTAYVPAVVKTWEAVSEEDHRVSHRPSPSQSHRPWRDALGSASEQDDQSKTNEWYATGAGGE